MNDLNRKLFDENQSYKERSREQRQQLEHYHTLLHENRANSERELADVRAACADELQRQLGESRVEHERACSTLRQRIDELRSNESRLVGEIGELREALRRETARSLDWEEKCKRAEADKSAREAEWASERESSRREWTATRDQLESRAASLAGRLETSADALRARDTEHEAVVAELRRQLAAHVLARGELEARMGELEREHERDSLEWAKFQSDLQTAVRVANDFMTEAEEKMIKMRDECSVVKEREAGLVHELKRLRDKLLAYESHASAAVLSSPPPPPPPPPTTTTTTICSRFASATTSNTNKMNGRFFGQFISK